MERKPSEAYRSWRSDDRKPASSGLPGKQIALLIGANAVIALVVSIVVTLTLGGGSSPATVAIATQTPAPTTGATNTPAPNATTSSGETIYVVKAGDSLSAIAFQYGISIEELMAANGLTDPDVLFVGQRLVIPAPGSVTLPTATPAPAQPTEARTAVPTNTRPTGPDLRIESVHTGADAYAVLTNWGTWARVKGWTLDDGQGHVYTFPDLSLFQGGSVKLHATAGTNTEADLYWGSEESVFVSGATLTLKSDLGVVVTSYTIP